MGKVVGRKWIDVNGNYTRVPNIVLDDSDLSPCARQTYSLMVRHAFWDQPSESDVDLVLATKISIDELSDLMDCGKRSVSRYVKELEDKSLIDRARRLGRSSQTIIFNPNTAYNTVSTSCNDEDSDPSRHATGDMTSCHQCHHVMPPVTSCHATGGMRTSQDVLIQDIQKQEPRNDVAALNIASDELKNSAEKKETTPLVPKDQPVDETENVVLSPDDEKVVLARNGAKKFGLLSNQLDKARSSLTSRSVSKIGAPVDAIGLDTNNKSTALDVWWTLQRAIIENFSSYTPPERPTGREMGNCKILLGEYKPTDIIGLFDMVVTRWSVVMEKWPHIAKTPTPTFYAAFTLRRDLMPLVQSGKGLTSRANRVDTSVEAPKIGWGDK